MKILEYGDKQKETILIIHGEQHKNWDKKIIKKDWIKKYHILILVMSKQDNAENLEQYINQYEHIFAIYCFHDEWKLVLTIIGKQSFSYDKLVIESSACIPGKLVEEFVL